MFKARLQNIYPAASDDAYIILLHHKGLWLSIEVHVYSIVLQDSSQTVEEICGLRAFVFVQRKLKVFAQELKLNASRHVLP